MIFSIDLEKIHTANAEDFAALPFDFKKLQESYQDDYLKVWLYWPLFSGKIDVIAYIARNNPWKICIEGDINRFFENSVELDFKKGPISIFPFLEEFDDEFNQIKNPSSQKPSFTINGILDKILEKGLKSLSEVEEKFLKRWGRDNKK